MRARESEGWSLLPDGSEDEIPPSEFGLRKLFHAISARKGPTNPAHADARSAKRKRSVGPHHLRNSLRPLHKKNLLKIIQIRLDSLPDLVLKSKH